jgi:hypothetical protein
MAVPSPRVAPSWPSPRVMHLSHWGYGVADSRSIVFNPMFICGDKTTCCHYRTDNVAHAAQLVENEFVALVRDDIWPAYCNACNVSSLLWLADGWVILKFIPEGGTQNSEPGKPSPVRATFTVVCENSLFLRIFGKRCFYQNHRFLNEKKIFRKAFF